MLGRLSFSVKITLITILLVLGTVLIMGVINNMRMKGALDELGERFLQNSADQLENVIKMQNDITQEKVVADLALMQLEFERRGQALLDETDTVTMEIVNQITKAKETVTIPKLKVGDATITGNFDIVDQVQKTVGGTATVFQVLPGKLLRVSTNVLKLDGNRATGTYIPDSSPVYQTVMRGETFRGKAFVVNDWYITAYKPVKDASGKIVAVIYVGRLILTPQLKNTVDLVDIGGSGYAFVINSKGEVLVHPSEEASKLNFKELPFAEALYGGVGKVVRYSFGGADRLTAMRYFEPWDWYIGVTQTQKEVYHGMDDKLVSAAALSGIIALLLAATISFFIIRGATAPLRRMALVAKQIAGGDMQARMDVESRDEIGDLAKEFNSLMNTIDETLCQNDGYINMLNAVTDPIYAVSFEGDVISANQAAAEMAGERQYTDMVGKSVRELSRSSVAGAALYKMDFSQGVCQGLDCEPITVTVRGETHTYRPTGGVIQDCNGKDAGHVQVLKDVTDLVERERDMAKNLERITSVNHEIGDASGQLAGAVDTLNNRIEEALSGAELQSQRAGETATAMEEMNATVLEVARNASESAENAIQAREKADEGARVVEQSVTAITSVQSQVRELKDKMGELGRQAQDIGNIINVINDIADQTNLLALNAAIEAARAGEAGRGFAVVADEVRKLAEKTMTATKEVEAAIASIQRNTNENIAATERAAGDMDQTTNLARQSGEILGQILSLVTFTSDQVQSIATAAEEQSAASEEINQAVEEVNRIATDNREAMRSSAHAVEELDQLASRLRTLAES